ncbi:MAG: glycosyltransferase family 4 protein [Rhodothermaceae bacterium]|nr:glycosyltransferase family 4 protein [Rhodothermaceae bacterium]
MKILLSAYACEPNRGSEEGFGWNWSTHLAKEGHEVWVITRPHTKEIIEKELASNPIPNINFIYVDIPKKFKRFIKGQIGVYAHYFIWQRTIVEHAKTFLKTNSIDLIHHVTWGSLIGGSRLWTLGIPFIFGPVGGGQVAPSAFKEYFYSTWRQESIRTYITERILPKHPLTQKMLRHTALLLATNSDTLNIARRMGAPRAELFLDTGLPASYYSNKSKIAYNDGKMNILWVGRSLERKALRLSLEAVSRLKFPFRMTILGDGPQDNLINNWITELDLTEKVEWKGRVPWHEVQKALEDHEIFLFTSLRDSFGSQLLEAMSNGLAIVTLDHQGAHDFVPASAGLRVPVTTPTQTAAALAEALSQFKGNTELLKSMSSSALAFAQENEWSIKASQMTKLYETVVKSPDKQIAF